MNGHLLMPRQAVKNQGGYTLIEAVLVIVIVGAIAVMLAAPLLEGGRAWDQIGRRKDITQLGRGAMDRMVRELVTVQRLAANTPNITAAGATNISFTAGSGAAIAFAWAGGGSPLQRNGNDLANNVQGLNLTYYDGRNCPVGSGPCPAGCPVGCPMNLPLIRRVLIRLTLVESGETVSFGSNTTLRNLLGL